MFFSMPARAGIQKSIQSGDTSPHSKPAPLPAPRLRLPSQHVPPLRLLRPDLAGVPAMRSLLSASLLSLLLPAAALAQSPGNRLAYLDECNPYYPSRTFPKLITPQWVGEEGVEAVVILAIDDMRDPKRYEAFLRPIL